MPDLERDLRALGGELAFPPTPDLVTAVRARTAEPRRRFAGAGRPLAIILAALAVAVAIAFAVPAARSAILRVFGIGGIRVQLVDRLTEHPLGRARIPGRPTTLEAARAAVAFDFGVPAADGFDDPDEVYVGQEVPGGVVFLVYGPARRPRALLTAFEANGLQYASKSAGPGTRFRSVSVGGSAGAWLEGAPHLFVFFDRSGTFHGGTLRLATNTLIWQRGTVTYRLEGHLTLAQALDVANSLHEPTP
jgi:hypothetical protein